MTGTKYIQALKVRGNLWPTRARQSRGRSGIAPMCDAGCPARETLGHMSQSCSRTHDKIVERHDGVCKLIAKRLERLGYAVRREQGIQTPDGLRRPDIIATKGTVAYVLDSSIVADAGIADLSQAYRQKVDKYQRYASTFKKYLSEVSDLPPTTVTYGAAILSWRGAMCSLTANILTTIGFTKSDFLLMATRTIEGSVRCAVTFAKRTTGAGLRHRRNR